jgi:hypothetical protein
MRQVEEENVKRVIAMAAIRELATLRIRVWDGGDGFVLDFPDFPYTTVPKKGETVGMWLDRLKTTFQVEPFPRRRKIRVQLSRH